MTTIVTTLLSVLALAGVAWGARRLLRAPLCPVCVGVAGTWLWMLIARGLGQPVDPGMLAILLGASVSGIAYQVDRRLPPGRSSALWKMLFVPGGLVAAYALFASLWGLAVPVGIALLLLTAFVLLPGSSAQGRGDTVDALKDRMRQCC